MGRCWSCGSQISGGFRYLFTCPNCAEVQETAALRKEVTNSLDYLAQVQRHGFETLSRSISEIASILQWGFEEVRWELQQQTDLLRSIDHTLKTPSKTQANEWRGMAEQLRQRGVLNKSEELFLKALDLNPLDYRIYVGLAHTYLKNNAFDKARTMFEKSIPHAPKGIIGKRDQAPRMQIGGKWYTSEEAIAGKDGITDEEYQSVREGTSQDRQQIDLRSYSFRLIGRTYFCEENYGKAMQALKNAIELSPTYIDGHYDFAQYCSLIEAKDSCIKSLKTVLIKRPSYFYLVQKERNFNPLLSEVTSLLNQIGIEPKRQAIEKIKEAEYEFNEANQHVEKTKTYYVKTGYKGQLKCLDQIAKAKNEFGLAKEKLQSQDYPDYLEAINLANTSVEFSRNALKSADEARDSIIISEKKRNYENAQLCRALVWQIFALIFALSFWPFVYCLVTNLIEPGPAAAFMSISYLSPVFIGRSFKSWDWGRSEPGTHISLGWGCGGFFLGPLIGLFSIGFISQYSKHKKTIEKKYKEQNSVF